MRLISTLKIISASWMGNPNYLPSSPSAFHALTFALADALFCSFHMESDRHASFQEVEFDHIKSSIVDLLDKLADARLIPLVGTEWDRFVGQHDENSAVPTLAAKFCVAEALCRSIKVDAYDRNAVTLGDTRGKFIMQELLPVIDQCRSTIVIQC